MVNEFTVISLFAGCGGSSLGYKMAGFKELLAVDFDENAVETFKLNFSAPIWKRDIKTISGQEILDFCKIQKGDLDILDGSPPCQGFSTAGKLQVNDIRNELVFDYIRILNDLQPKIFIMENVSGMAKGKMKGLFNQIISEFKKTNYILGIKQLNAANYGVPQIRERIFFIGVRKDLNLMPVFPKPLGKIITVKDALENCKPTNYIKICSYSEWSKQLKYGQSVGKIHPKGFGFNMIKCDPNKPAPTITKTHTPAVGLLHPFEDRFLSIPELKRLASFPDNFKFPESISIAWANIGNAVMPLQMKAIAETIKIEILEKSQSATKQYQSEGNEVTK